MEKTLTLLLVLLLLLLLLLLAVICQAQEAVRAASFDMSCPCYVRDVVKPLPGRKRRILEVKHTQNEALAPSRIPVNRAHDVPSSP